jgi:serine/threonine-protein kinase HipA
MEKVGKALGSYSANPLLDKLFLFEITLFSYLTGNNDMHLKNFSMIQNKRKWTLAPSYDLLNVSIILPEDTEELALTQGGKKRKLTRKSFETYGKDLGLNDKQIDGAFKRFLKNRSKAFRLIEQSFLSEEMQNKYITFLNKRYDVLY